MENPGLAPKRKSNRKKLAIGSLLVITILVPSITLGCYYSFVETSYLDGLRVRFDSNYLSIQGSRWVTPSFQGDPFVFEIETYGTGNPLYANVTHSVNYYDMGTTDWFKENCTSWGEWGYSFHHLTGGAIDGAGVAHFRGFPITPRTKQEAYDYICAYITNFTSHLDDGRRPWVSFNGHYPYHHYAAEFGFDKIGTEIGENMESYQILMAFNRGAARQYNLPWFVDVSAWYGAGITDYNDPTLWTGYGGANRGHSLSLYRRTYYMAYMTGASRVIAEGGSGNYFYHTPDPTGLMPLTPLGELGREFAQFINDHPDRGIPYTPVALYIDALHGTPGFIPDNPFEHKKAFNAIPFTKGDEMTYKLLDTIFPGGWHNENKEKCQLVNNEFGDLFDIILQNASIEVLRSYPLVFMTGDIHLSPEESTRLVDYVAGGGTLVVNSAYFKAINEALRTRGSNTNLHLNLFESVKVQPGDGGSAGQFVLYGPDFDTLRVRALLREFLPHLLPFKITTSGPFGSDQGK